MGRIARTLLAVAAIFLLGCRKAEFSPVLERASVPSEANGYVAGLFAGQEGFAFDLLNVDSHFSRTLPFVGKPIQDHLWHIYDPAIQMLELPPGTYRVTAWQYVSPNFGSIHFRKEMAVTQFEIRPGRVTCIGKFESVIPPRGTTLEFRIEFQVFRKAEFLTLLGRDYPGFVSVPVDFSPLRLDAKPGPKPAPAQKTATPVVNV